VYLVVQAIVAKVVSVVAVDWVVSVVEAMSVASVAGVSGAVVEVSVKDSGISLSFGLTLGNDVSVAIHIWAVGVWSHNSLGGHSVDDRGGDDRGGQAVGVGDSGVDHVVGTIETSTVDTSTIDTSTVDTSVGVDSKQGVSLGLRVSLALNQVCVASVSSVASGQWMVETIVVESGGLDNSRDNSLGGHGGDDRAGVSSVGSDGAGHNGVGTIDISTVDSIVGTVDEESWVSLSLGLGLGISLTLDEVGAIDMGVSSGVGDNGAGHGLVDKGEGLVDQGGGVDQGLAQVSVGLSSQVLGLGSLDGQGLARDNSSIGMLHLGLNLGVGIAINQRLGKEDLRVSLWGSLGGSGQSNSDESLHFGCKVFVLLAFLR